MCIRAGAVMLGHVAFTVARLGEDEAAARLKGRVDVSREDIQRGSRGKRAARMYSRVWSASGRCLVAWLPFRRDVVLADDDWAGHPRLSLGSSFALAAQLDHLRELYAKRRRPLGVTARSDLEDEEAPTVLPARPWQCGAAMARLATAATERRLPMWLAGGREPARCPYSPSKARARSVSPPVRGEGVVDFDAGERGSRRPCPRSGPGCNRLQRLLRPAARPNTKHGQWWRGRVQCVSHWRRPEPQRKGDEPLRQPSRGLPLDE